MAGRFMPSGFSRSSFSGIPLAFPGFVSGMAAE